MDSRKKEEKIRALPTYFVHSMCHQSAVIILAANKIGIFSYKIAIASWLRSASALATNDDDDYDDVDMVGVAVSVATC